MHQHTAAGHRCYTCCRPCPSRQQAYSRTALLADPVRCPTLRRTLPLASPCPAAWAARLSSPAAAAAGPWRAGGTTGSERRRGCLPEGSGGAAAARARAVERGGAAASPSLLPVVSEPITIIDSSSSSSSSMAMAPRAALSCSCSQARQTPQTFLQVLASCLCPSPHWRITSALSASDLWPCRIGRH